MSPDRSAMSTSVLGAMLRHKFVSLVVIALGVAGGVAYGIERPPQPTASVLIVVHDPNYAGSDGSVDARYAADQVNLLRGYGVAQGASQILANQPNPVALTPKQVMAALSVSNSGSDNTMTVHFKAKSETTASAGIEAVVTAYETSVARTQHSQTAAQVTSIDEAITGLNAQAATATRNNQPATLAQVQLAESELLAQRAQLLTSDSNPTPGVAGVTPPAVTVGRQLSSALRDGGFGLVLGLLAAALLAYLMANRRRRMFDPADPARAFGVRLLGSLGGRAAGQQVSVAMGAATLESTCRQLGARIVGVVSAGADGSGGVTSQLQQGYEALGKSCFVVDPDRDVRHLTGLEDYDVVLVEVPDVQTDPAAVRALSGVDAAVLVVPARTGARRVESAVAVVEGLGVKLAGYVFVQPPRWQLSRRPRALTQRLAASRVRADATA